ncbi:hypothetical protein CAEBREN_08401 [Caenorhabditis brenneri]|uniref:Uncharacterized protein n=1 Tax=Caenorhabditis brenneri TaxID=135651 RepID=G0N2Y0_CAEBE|nr:hypothetical protein CAEBREN_08401 [Caenorhabditis brenneri]
MPPARGAKTLGWFMEADFLKGQQQQQQMNGGAPAQTTTYGAAAGAGVIRRGSSSDDSKSTTPSSNGTPSHHHHHYQPQQHRQTVSSTSSSSNPQQKKQKKYSKRVPTSSGAARKEGFHAAGGQMSESSEDGLPTTTTTVIPPATSTATATVPPPPPTVGANQEEYWFYDVASDGYYYEQNGAKGWRRRQPNAAVHKANGKEQEVAHMNVNGRGKYDQLLAAQAAAAHAAYIQHAIQLMSQNPGSSGAQNPQNPQNPPPHLNPPTMRYYDPNSDGFYYEMASVDGWKRRQPNKPASASLPHGMVSRPLPPPPGSMMMMAPPPPRGMFGSDGGSSYGAALARGQFPRNTVKHPEDPDPLLLHSGTETPGAPPSRDSAASSSSMSAGGDSCCFAELFGTGSGSGSTGSTSVPRPSSLNLEQKSVSPQIENTTPLDSSIGLLNAILADFNGGGKTYNNYASLNSILPPIPGMNSQQNSPMKGCATTTTPGDSWNSFRSCSLFSPIKPSKRVLVPSATPLGSAPSSNQPMGMMDQDGDDTLNMVMRDLDKLWTTTPVSGLNQA